MKKYFFLLCFCFLGPLSLYSAEYLFEGAENEDGQKYKLSITGKPNLKVVLKLPDNPKIEKKIRNVEYLFFHAHFKTKGHLYQAVALSKLKSLENTKKQIPMVFKFNYRDQLIEYQFDRAVARYSVDAFLIERINYFERQVSFLKNRK